MYTYRFIYIYISHFCIRFYLENRPLVSFDHILRGVRERLQEKRDGGGSWKIKQFFLNEPCKCACAKAGWGVLAVVPVAFCPWHSSRVQSIHVCKKCMSYARGTTD